MSLRGIASAFATVLLVVMAGIGVSMLQGHFLALRQRKAMRKIGYRE